MLDDMRAMTRGEKGSSAGNRTRPLHLALRAACFAEAFPDFGQLCCFRKASFYIFKPLNALLCCGLASVSADVFAMFISIGMDRGCMVGFA